MKTIWTITMLLIPSAQGYTTRLTQADADLKSLESAVAMFKLNAKRPPPAEIGLRALVERPPGFGPEVRWVQLMSKLPKDPWGAPYRYVAGDGFPEGYGIYSEGADGTSETQGNDVDDLNSWRTEGPEYQGYGKLRFLGIASAGSGLVFVGFLLGIRFAKRRINPPLTVTN